MCHLQSVPPIWGHIATQFSNFSSHIWKLRPVQKPCFKIFHTVPWHILSKIKQQMILKWTQKKVSQTSKKFASCIHHPLAITVLCIVNSPFLHGVEIGSKCLPGGGGGMVQDCFCGLRNFFDNQFKMICCLILLNVEVPSDRSWNKFLR